MNKNTRTKSSERGVSALGARDADRELHRAKIADRRRKAETHDNPDRPWGIVRVNVNGDWHRSGCPNCGSPGFKPCDC